ncbi:hypothetical protein NDU88_002130 [Pleurodeles waltl]|uniref:Uncharacterized protein n=1 Tax=Pleurodeles waltl TaxID=8319 RepID=A0AAV7M2G6_PLEWA|nr:hypothetical protein NDU88_002130 [Pleurodeles waltl]
MWPARAAAVIKPEFVTVGALGRSSERASPGGTARSALAPGFFSSCPGDPAFDALIDPLTPGATTRSDPRPTTTERPDPKGKDTQPERHDSNANHRKWREENATGTSRQTTSRVRRSRNTQTHQREKNRDNIQKDQSKPIIDQLESKDSPKTDQTPVRTKYKREQDTNPCPPTGTDQMVMYPTRPDPNRRTKQHLTEIECEAAGDLQPGEEAQNTGAESVDIKTRTHGQSTPRPTDRKG